MFAIRMGVPGMKNFWDSLLDKKKTGEMDTQEIELFNKLAKTLRFLSNNPRHPGLRTHEIEALSNKYDMKIWQSYLDQGQKARRIFWTYGPNRKEITILGIEPHPEDKRGSYDRIKLSDLPG
ncbi:MAG: hypothetical protein U5K31_09870 [Balneolaceae bacterium]|nr:hypothetical protein [Balneolaceae bacterium]